MNSKICLLFFASVMFLQSEVVTSQAKAGLIHDFQLNGNLTDSVGTGVLVSAGGTIGATGYSFGPNQGLSLSNFSTPANYSIELLFSFETLSGYQKIIDFKDLASDDGLYSSDDALVLYGGDDGPAGGLRTNEALRLIVTRDGASKRFVAYINGVQQFSSDDTGDVSVFSGTNSIIHFFQDDMETDQDEAASGFVDMLRIYDRALTEAEVGAISGLGPAAVPEPSFGLLGGLGMILFGGRRYLRKRAKAATV